MRDTKARRYGNARAARPRREARRGRAAAFGAQAGAASIGSPMQAAGCIASARGGG
ncbi:unnamed protein product [Burkholderia pseudomallei]|nr:hypothetical protein BURPSS13_X0290 [Burkholderia pseudomallei S13]VUD60935.1 unnamed protein product [Burkholderia pseudomallei]VUD63397.1 unnamed protein product [Burkholderia pseudomallei]VUD63558.1 unnamed protein product [Burkholderia pseudomallei]